MILKRNYGVLSREAFKVFSNRYLTSRAAINSLIKKHNEDQLVWQIKCSVLVERIPLISAQTTQLQKDIDKLYQQIEFENSLFSDHEMRHLNDEKNRKLREMGEVGAGIALKTALDDEEKWKNEYKQFEPQSIQTQADLKNDKKSIHRALDRTLKLIMKQNFGKFVVWSLPTANLGMHQTLRESAEQALLENCGNEFNVEILGNSPWGYFKLKNDIDEIEKSGYKGQKFFVFKAHYKDGKIRNDNYEHMWALDEELDNLVHNKCRKTIRNITFGDSP